ncbi:plexin domain-containing protein 2-like [Oculina patagonica]
MKCLALLLFVGVFLPCFYRECEAFQYRDLRHNGRSYVLEAENTVDKVRHHRSRRESPPGVLTNQTDFENVSSTCQDKTEKINHRYYVSQVVNSGQGYWINIQGDPKTVEQPYLSDSYLLLQNYTLSFKFPYYGHLLDQVMLSTGGFLYMDTHLTKLMTQVQYVAPLMAYFDPHLQKSSKVLTLDDGSKLTVEWYKVLLHDNTTVGPFTFQCTLHKNGTIWFAYKEIPMDVDKIPVLPYHPVKVGIANAYVIRYIFYIYSVINITKQSVVNNAAVIFEPQLSCVGAQTCTVCMERTAETTFTCQWCPKIQKCSDGVDRHREEWERNECNDNAIKEMSEECLHSRLPAKRKLKDKKGIGAGAIIGIILIFVLAWCVYAYNHPTSKSGLFLIEATRKPRDFFKRSPGVSGNTGPADPSDIKPQVL